MDFIVEQDVDAPVAAVFAALTDFKRLETDARARGMNAERSDSMAAPGIGTAWRVEYMMRGGQRRALMQITAWTPPEGYAIAAQSNLMDLAATFRFTALGPATTRVRIEAQVSARSLPGRILLQSARLGRSRIDDRLSRGLERLCDRIATDYPS
jgi:uncharacterized protein YndB with AHSA1/START domain